MSHLNRKATRRKVHFRIRRKVTGDAARPRLAVSFSNQHVYAQIIDDTAGKTLASVSTTEKTVTNTNSANANVATEVGKLIAERAKAQNIESVVFDRGGFLFHGKVKALADAAREGGLQF